MAKNWYGDVLCKVHFDMHTPGVVERVGEEFDAARFAGLLADAGAEAVCFFSRCAYGWSYYPTRIGNVHPHLKRDLVGEASRACKDAGIRLIAYMAIDCMVPEAAQKHPEWRYRKADGSLQAIKSELAERPIMCLCGPYLEGFLIPQMQEIARNYPVSGLFLDGMYVGYWEPCYCDFCRKDYGGPMPDRPDHPDWHRFRSHKLKKLWELHEKATRAVQAVRPDLILATNWHGRSGWALRPWEGSTCLTGDAPVEGNHALEAACQLDAWAWRGIPCDVMNARMLWWWSDWTTRPGATLRTEAASSIAHGGSLFVGDLLDPVRVTPNPSVMELIGDTFAFAKKRAHLARGAEPAADVAIYISREGLRDHPELVEVDAGPWRGSHLALTEGGWTRHILHDGDLEGNLTRYKTLLIPEQGALPSGVKEIVRSFVESGGALVVTGETPLEAPGKFLLGDILGIEPTADPGWDRAFVDPREAALEGFPPAWEANRAVFPVLAKPVAVRPVSCEVKSFLFGPGPAYQFGACPPGPKSQYPAVTLRKLGKGRAAYVSLPLAREFWKRGSPNARHLLNAVIALVTPEPTVRVEAPASLDVALARRKNELLVHLTAYTPERRDQRPPLVERTPPVGPISLRVRAESRPVEVRLEPEGVPLDFQWDSGVVSARVEKIEIHGCVVLRF